VTSTAPQSPSGPGESVTTFIQKVRTLSQQARPAPQGQAQTVESWSPALAAALLELSVRPSAEAHRHVATEYRQLGILDMTYRHLSEALRLEPNDAAAHDAIARVWRDWGFPHLGMTDALRAVQLAPTSPEAANTVGTLFQAMGETKSARAWYERSLTLDRNVPYALNNLCYTAILLRRPDAVDACDKAVSVAPGSKSALNNLGLAYAARGDLQNARAAFDKAGDAAADYNMGIVYLSTRQYEKAVASFDAARRADPNFSSAAARARQARDLAARNGNN
jgi:tetratricopeptide (TPR) repeat protein